MLGCWGCWEMGDGSMGMCVEPSFVPHFLGGLAPFIYIFTWIFTVLMWWKDSGCNSSTVELSLVLIP